MNNVDKDFILIDDITKDFLLINEYLVVYNYPALNVILYNTSLLSIIVVNNTRDINMIYDFNILQTRSYYLRSASIIYNSSSKTLRNKNSKFVLAFDLKNSVKKHHFSVFHYFFNQLLILNIKQIKSK